MKFYNTRNDLLSFFEKNLVVCEIGVFKGDFAKVIKSSMDPKELHLIDLFSGDMTSGDKDGNNIETIKLDPFYEDLISFYKLDDSVFIKKGKSSDVLKTYQDNYFDFIYIDADHSYEGVKSDLEQSLLKIKVGGFIGGHDFHPYHFPGVVSAVTEFCTKTNNEIVCMSMDNLPSFVIKINNK